MLLRRPRIVRLMSVSRPDTWRVTRARKNYHRPTTAEAERSPARLAPTSAPPAPTTPVPPAELLAAIGELESLLDELDDLTGCGSTWAMRMLRRNVAVALRRPDSLESEINQLDFVEELAEAVWDGGDAAFRHAVRTAATPDETPDETARREDRRRAVVERLDQLAHRFCAAGEAWAERTAAAADATS